MIQEARELEGKDWDGGERRSIPVHILNYMDERLAFHTQNVEELFNGHTKDEMVRYDLILKMIADNGEKSQARHNELVDALAEYTVNMDVKCRNVLSAFIKDESGAPDFDGHRQDHDKRKRFGDWWMRTKDSALSKFVEWGALAFLIWVIHSMWEAFLKGPNK